MPSALIYVLRVWFISICFITINNVFLFMVNLFVDIDECQENDGLADCQKGCVNTPGSYRCYCPGQWQYTSEDSRTCRGNFKNSKNTLFRHTTIHTDKTLERYI